MSKFHINKRINIALSIYKKFKTVKNIDLLLVDLARDMQIF